MGFSVTKRRAKILSEERPQAARRPARVLRLRVPYPPPLWKRYRRVDGVGRLKSAEYRAWLRLARGRLDRSPRVKHFGGPVSVAVHLPTPVRGRHGLEMMASVMAFLGSQGLIDGEDSIARICLCRTSEQLAGELLIEVRAA